MQFQVLGPVRIRDSSGSPLIPNRRKQRELLGLLLLRANTSISNESITDALWGERPPASAAVNLQSNVANLRRLLDVADTRGGDRLQTTDGGYALHVEPDELDAASFQRLAAAGRAALDTGDAAVAAERLARALGRWHGEVLEGLDLPALEPDQVRLRELRLTAIEDGFAARLALGEHRDLPAELEGFVRRNPLREMAWGQLMLALYRSGRRGEALTAYQRLSDLLVNELGIGPSESLGRLHGQILIADPGLSARPGAGRVRERVVNVDRITGHSAPAQLPAEVHPFTGRQVELSALEDILGVPDRVGVSPRAGVCVVSGPAGVGKTALVLHWAHRATHAFPDGQLHVDLQGKDRGRPLRPEEALAGFLRALGVPGADLPPGRSELAARYRTEIAGRRVLLVIDGASSVEQVWPLLPGTTGAIVIVTSRHSLSELVALHGARRIYLGPLPTSDADTLLRGLMGNAYVDANPAAARTLTEHSGGFPRALRIAAEAASRRHQKFFLPALDPAMLPSFDR